MTALGPAAVTVTDLLSHLTAADIRAARAHARATNPALLDQLDAAQAEAVWLGELAVGHPASLVPTKAVPEWIRLSVVDATLTWVAGRAETCLCSPDPRRPQPVYAAAWRPGVISCLQHEGWLMRLTGDADRTCDQCGTVVEVIFPSAVVFGPLTFRLGLCRDCRSGVLPANGSGPTPTGGIS